MRKGSLANTANSKTTVLFDQGYLTTAYPRLTVSGGKGAVVRMRYAEALFKTSPREKGNRNEIEGKEFIGNYDEFVLDGGAHRVFRPLWWRTYRYLQLEIETRDEPVTIEGITATATGFPFVRKATFDAGVPELNQILDVGWRTARLCAHETYMDCPYYEQLQYAGDTRVQCLVSLFQTGDARLMRNAIDLLNDSRQSDGCTMSRYPTRLEQYIPGFALWWVGMVHDYHWYVADARLRAPHAARRAQRAQLLRGLSEGERLARFPALVALLRLGPGMAERRRAAGCRWRRRALRSAVAHGLPLGRRAGEGGRPPRTGAGL